MKRIDFHDHKEAGLDNYMILNFSRGYFLYVKSGEDVLDRLAVAIDHFFESDEKATIYEIHSLHNLGNIVKQSVSIHDLCSVQLYRM